jgi:aldose 1-epimerase
VITIQTAFALCLLPFLANATANFTAVQTTDSGVEVIRLTDSGRQVEVAIAPSIGNRAYEMKVHGKNILHFPQDVGTYKKEGARGLNGIPFLAPWANRMASAGFWAGTRRYEFNAGLGTVRPNPSGVAMHGMLTASPAWKIVDVGADGESAHVTSKLEFWKYPDMMANWPIAHEYEMTYRLSANGLEVIATVTNLSTEAMPVAIGFHPYFTIPDVPRAECVARIPARKHVETDKQLVATGELKANDLPESISLRDHTFDDGYTDLIRDASGRTTFFVEGRGKKIEVVYGPKYTVAVVYSPPNQNFICFEPMSSITNGVNLAHDGKYSELQTVAPGAKWRESFWVRTSGL